jgi:hypothetical protein
MTAPPNSGSARQRDQGNEGQAEREEDLQQVPDHSQAWSGHGHLL